MMWKTDLPNSQFSSDPIELRILKQQLANVSCKCSSCNNTCESLFEKTPRLRNKKDIEVQAERYFTVDPKSNFIDNNKIKDALCPTCCMTLNILRGGVVKVLKDEESETLASMFSADKATGKRFKSVEKTTSFAKPLANYSNLTLCDFISDTSTDFIKPISSIASGSHRKRCHYERVKFDDSAYQIPESVATKPFRGNNCTCLENFIDSIRPPLDYVI